MNHNKSLILNETRFININLIDNIILPSIKLRDSIIPPVPFIWYREEELLCPIDGLFKVNNITIKKLLNIFDSSLVNILDKFNFNKYYIVVQKNLLDTSA